MDDKWAACIGIAYGVFESLDYFFREFIQVWKQHD